MIIISHRGLLVGQNKKIENSPSQIDLALDLGFDVELDLHYYKDDFWLGHDEPTYKIDLQWLQDRGSRLWIHCKNIDALLKMKETTLHYFWHQEDTVTLTSRGYIWAYPRKDGLRNTIAVLPEIHNADVTNCIGVCTDYPKMYNRLYRNI